ENKKSRCRAYLVVLRSYWFSLVGPLLLPGEDYQLLLSIHRNLLHPNLGPGLTSAKHFQDISNENLSGLSTRYSQANPMVLLPTRATSGFNTGGASEYLRQSLPV
ncbi:MAG: hypothetical protein ABI865_09590, partial [Nitrosospira sp.]